MGLRRVSDALKEARGTLSQKAAAAHFHVPYTTLCALEQRQDRNYQPHTLARFDEMLGTSTRRLLEEPDEPAVEDLASRLEGLEARLAGLEELLANAVVRSPSAIERLAAELDDAERDQVVAYIHFLLSRRIRGSA